MEILNKNPFTHPRGNHYIVKLPQRVVEDATLTIHQIAARFIRGSLDGVNVHERSFSTELNPLCRKGIDLCDFTDIQSQTAHDKRLASEQLERLKQLQNASTTPPSEPVSEEK